MNDETKLFEALNSDDEDRIEATFNYFYKKYKGLLVFIAASFIKNKEDIEDLVQDTFITFFSKANEVKSNIKYYLVTTLKHNCLNKLRSEGKIDLKTDLDLDYISNILESNDNDISNIHFVDLIEDMKKHMDINDLKVIVYHLILGYEFDELESIVKVNKQTLKTRYYRALKKYKKEGDYLR